MNEEILSASLITVKNFIGGQFLDAADHLDSFNPATGQVWARIPDSSADEVQLAVSAALEAFPSWASATASFRQKILNKIADLVEANAEVLAKAESRDQGKPVWLASSVDIPRCAWNFRFFANLISYNTTSFSTQEDQSAFSYVRREPVGVAGLISPWNLPLYLLSFKIAPAIAVGNTVVSKPSELTSVTAYLLAKLFNEAGLPPGVVNFVFGTGGKTGDAIVRHPDVSLISFTGSTATGLRIAEISALLNRKVSLEMGGKNAAVVFADADMEKCVATTIRSSFLNQGEICLCTSRIYVERSVYDHFVSRFAAAAKQLKVGNPRVSDNFLGALISDEHLAKVRGYVEMAKAEGGKLASGDERMDMPVENLQGYFMRPTIIVGLTNDSRVVQEEIFGPVTCVLPFDTETEAIRLANDVKYGLSACVWSRDLSKVHRVSQKLKVGTVWCNCWLVRDLRMPFGGTKASGIGREGAEDSLDFFTEKKTICVRVEGADE